MVEYPIFIGFNYSLSNSPDTPKLKNTLDGIFKENELGYYREHLNKEILEERRKEIPELDLLLNIFET